MQQSDSIADLAAALAKAQATVGGAKKDSTNPHFKSSYADLESVWGACREALTSNGLSVLQLPGLSGDGQMRLWNQLSHSSGQWVRAEMSLPMQKVDPQGAVSAVTYMRRTALAGAAGVAPADDDGNAASRPTDSAVSNAQSTAKRIPLTGFYKTKQAVKDALGDFVQDLHGCSDNDMLDVVLSDNAPLINQMRTEEPLQYWRNGDGGDFLGMEREIEEARRRVSEPKYYEDSLGGIKGFDPKREDA